MRTLGGVFCTDGLSRDGIYMTVGALADMLWQSWEFGTPSNMSHDSLRLVGWSRATSLFLEPGLTQLTGTFEMPETKDEHGRLQDWAQAAQAKHYYDRRIEIESLREKLAPHTGDEAKHCLAGGVTLLEDGLATRVFPALFDIAQADKDGLVPLSELTPIGAGVYQIGELTVFAHPFFRRSMSRLNTLNQHFLARLQSLGQQGIPAKVALDPDLVGLASTYVPPMEFEYWWGPQFDNDLANITPGATSHSASQQDQIFYGISGTEFWWQSRKGLHTFEAEELRDAPVETEQFEGYFCRYAHSIVDEATGQVMHFDGAVRGYNEEQMIQRLEVDIKRAGRNSDYKKLWRLDSPIAIEQWKALLNDYYRDNRLVGEYLGAEPEPSPLEPPAPFGEEAVEATDGNAQFDVASSVPHALPSGSGVRIALSYHDSYQDMELESQPERRAIPLIRIGTGESDAIAVVEDATIELSKVLANQGQTLVLPPLAGVTHVHDSHSDFGLIAHGDSSCTHPQIVHTTLDAIHELTSAWERHDDSGTVAFTLAFPIKDKQVQIAIIGHVTDVNFWLAHPLSRIPTEHEALQQWLQKVAVWLRETYPLYSKPSPLLSAVMPFQGSLLRREFARNISLYYRDDEPIWKIESQEAEDLNKTIAAIEQGLVVPALRTVVNRSTCTRCQSAYPTCLCCKSLDEGVQELLENVVCMDAVWTNGDNWLINCEPTE